MKLVCNNCDSTNVSELSFIIKLDLYVRKCFDCGVIAEDTLENFSPIAEYLSEEEEEEEEDKPKEEEKNATGGKNDKS